MSPTTGAPTTGISLELIRIVVLDVSGSMEEPFLASGARGMMSHLTQAHSKFEAAKEYVRFAIQKMPETSKLVIIAFASAAKLIYQGSVTDKPKAGEDSWPIK